MRRNAKSITTSPEIVKHIDGLTEANFKLLTQLIQWLAGHEKQHTRYRMTVINRLARVEALVSLLLTGQHAQMHSKPPQYYADKLEEDAKAAEEFIDRQSEKAVMSMVRYIYGKERTPEQQHDRRRKWWGWEI